MTNPSEIIELLINRKLDGELSAGQEAELNEALAASPEHRDLFDEMSRVDRMCAEVIRAESRNERNGQVIRGPLAIPSRRGRGVVHVARWLVPMAAAACVAWMFWIAPASRQPDMGLVTKISPQAPMGEREQVPLNKVEPRSGASPYRTVSDASGRVNGRRDMRAFPVVGDDGNVYLIELDRTKTYRRPAQRPTAVKAAGQL